jgi:putative phosphoesterase
MNRLFVFSDLHGSLSGWLTIKALMTRGDGLAVAGDLFDTRYGRYGNPDFQPEQIRSDLKTVDSPFFYVYGNCDLESFFPGYEHQQTFTAFDKTIFIHHGHRPVPADCRADIIIQGHTHLCELEQSKDKIRLNPGSIALSRNSLPAYGVIDANGVHLIELSTGKPLKSIALDG